MQRMLQNQVIRVHWLVANAASISVSGGKGQSESKDDTLKLQGAAGWSALGNHKSLIKTYWKSMSFAATCVVYLLPLERTSSWSVSKTVRQEMEEGDSDVGSHLLSFSFRTLWDSIRCRNFKPFICKYNIDDARTAVEMYKNIQWNWFYFIAVEDSIRICWAVCTQSKIATQVLFKWSQVFNSHRFMLIAFFFLNHTSCPEAIIKLQLSHVSPDPQNHVVTINYFCSFTKIEKKNCEKKLLYMCHIHTDTHCHSVGNWNATPDTLFCQICTLIMFFL